MQTVTAIRGRISAALGVCLLLLIYQTAVAQVEIRGTVVDSRDVPLTDVMISGIWPKHPVWTEIGNTQTDGTFHISLPIDRQNPLPPADLKFTKNGYERQRQHFDLNRLPSELKITLWRKPQVALNREVSKFVGFRKQPNQHAIFISSFKLLNEPGIKTDGNCKCDSSIILTPCEKLGVTSAGAACECKKSKSEQLHCNIERHVYNHLMGKLSQIAKISVIAIKPDFNIDFDNLDYLGSYLNALGIVTGDGSLGKPTGGESLLALKATFLIPNRPVNMFPSRHKLITEEFPEKEFNNVHLAERLNEFWAHYTLLALAEREANASRTRDDYKRIIDYLREASHVTANANHKKDLDMLIQRIGSEMDK
jgi:hypothetical protein